MVTDSQVRITQRATSTSAPAGPAPATPGKHCLRCHPHCVDANTDKYVLIISLITRFLSTNILLISISERYFYINTKSSPLPSIPPSSSLAAKQN